MRTATSFQWNARSPSWKACDKTFMKRPVVRAALAILTLIVGFYVYLMVSNDPGCFWRNFSAARVTSNGQILPNARVWRRPGGMLLMKTADDSWYVYWPRENSIGLCNRVRSVSFPGYIYARDCSSTSCPCVEMGGAKTEGNPDLRLDQNSLEFNSSNLDHIRVSW